MRRDEARGDARNFRVWKYFIDYLHLISVRQGNARPITASHYATVKFDRDLFCCQLKCVYELTQTTTTWYLTLFTVDLNFQERSPMLLMPRVNDTSNFDRIGVNLRPYQNCRSAGSERRNL